MWHKLYINADKYFRNDNNTQNLSNQEKKNPNERNKFFSISVGLKNKYIKRNI